MFSYLYKNLVAAVGLNSNLTELFFFTRWHGYLCRLFIKFNFEYLLYIFIDIFKFDKYKLIIFHQTYEIKYVQIKNQLGYNNKYYYL